MAWRGDSWADIVARLPTSSRSKSEGPELEDATSLAARAQHWQFSPGPARVDVTARGLRIGPGIESVDVPFRRLYHVEPVDPWPSLAIGWVDRGEPYTTILALERARANPTALARQVDAVAETLRRRAPRALNEGWLAFPIQPWEKTDAMPSEREERPAMGGYRLAPEALDPVVASRVTASGVGSLFTWIWSRLQPVPRRVEPREVVLTKRAVYARTRDGARWRIETAHLRTSRRTSSGDTVYVFGRNTELLLVHQAECPLADALDARLG